MHERDIHLFLFEGFADWEASLAVAHATNPAPGHAAKYRVRTVGESRRPVRSLGGLTVVPDLELSALTPDASAMLVLAGASRWMEPDIEAVLALLRRFDAAAVPLAAICGGVFGLARAGLLDDRRHTGNEAGWLASSGYRGAGLFVAEPAVEDRGVITASAMAAVDFARLVLAKLDVFPPAALAAWYAYYKTGEAARFFAFVKALEAP